MTPLTFHQERAGNVLQEFLYYKHPQIGLARD